MRDGFLKVACASPRLRVADPVYNADEIIRLIREAVERDVRLLVLPELALTGKTCGDLFFQKRLIAECEAEMARVAEATENKNVLVLFGAPAVGRNGKLYNAAVAAFDGKIVGIAPKTKLSPAEGRWFAPGEAGLSFAPCASADGVCVGPLAVGIAIGDDPIPACPFAVLAHLSAEPEIIGAEEARRDKLLARSEACACAIVSAGAASGESTTDAVYAGHDMILEKGELYAEFKPFEAEGVLLTAEIDGENPAVCHPTDETGECSLSARYADRDPAQPVSAHPFIPDDPAELHRRMQRMLQIQAEGLARRVERAYSDGMVIGISGGLDSCLALLVAVKAAERLGMDKRKILAITMPCFGTTKRTRSNAEILCEELGVSFREVSIADSVRVHFAAIGHEESNHNVVFENGQARERTQVLMDIANGINALVVGTGDLSELALGWATYNGDHMSMYGVNASVPKTVVRYAVADCADEAEKKGKTRLADTLRDILDTPVSPELLPANGEKIAQVTEDLVGPYELHDFFLYHLARWGETPREIFRLAKGAFAGAYDDGVIFKWLATFCRRFFNQQFKRSCLPDGPKVGTVSLSPRGDFIMPSDASNAAWKRELDELKAEIGQ